MAETAEQIKALTVAINNLLQLQLQQKQTENISISQRTQQSTKPDLYNQLSARVEKYTYGFGDEIKPFSKWLLRYEYTIVTETASVPSEMQTRLVLDKLGQTEFDRHLDHVAPTDPTKMLQKDLISILKKLFREKIPITHHRIEVRNYRCDRAIPIIEHIDRINRHAADFDRAKLTDNNFRNLLLLQSFCYLRANEELKKLSLRVIEKNQDASLRDITADLEAHLNVSCGLKTLENPVKSFPSMSCSAVKAKKLSPRIKKDQANPKPNVKCNGYSGTHVRSKCNFRDAVCYKCAKKSHIAEVCSTALKDSKSVGKNASIVAQTISTTGRRRRRYVTTSIDSRSFCLQYDTGSDITVIGIDEWIRLGSPKLAASKIVEHAGGCKLKLIDRFRASVRVADCIGKVDIDVADRRGLNLLDFTAMHCFGLYTSVFE